MSLEVHHQLQLAAEAIAAAVVTQRNPAECVRPHVCTCSSGDLRLALLAPGAQFVTNDNTLLLGAATIAVLTLNVLAFEWPSVVSKLTSLHDAVASSLLMLAIVIRSHAEGI